MSEEQPSTKSLAARLPRFTLKNRFSGPLARCIFVGIITLFLLIPLGMVNDVVYERSYLYEQATRNIRSSWGYSQSINGPVLIIPYESWKDRKETIVVDKKKEEVVTREYFRHFRVVLPTTLSFDSILSHEVRYRGIYRQTLYTAPVDIKGSFTLPEANKFEGNIHKIHWDKAWLAVGVSDLKTIAEATPLEWNGQALGSYSPGSNSLGLVGPGFHINVPLNADEAGSRRDFALHLTIRGSGGISFTPVGENTSITIASTWPSPSFQGNLLPVERNITPQGFTAKWLVSNLTRSYPQTSDIEEYLKGTYNNADDSGSLIVDFTAGVDLHETVTLYRMVKRATDYGILFIAVSFVALFAFEMITRRRMHLLQYGMVGLSMSVFYLVLLSLAEHISFGWAFVAAGAVTVAMNSLYVGSALASKAKGLIMAGLLTLLYGVLFSILRMEDVALLVGTALVLSMMGVLMYVTRKLPQGSVE